MLNSKRLLASCLAAVFFIALMTIFGIYDLDISNALANMESSFGLTMELSGMLVAPYLFMTAGLVIAVYCHKSPAMPFRKTKLGLGILSAFGGICFCSYVYVQMSAISSFVLFLLTGIALGLLIVALRKRTKEQLLELVKISTVTIVYLLAVLVVINLIKVFWGRVRFREMTDPTQFSHWFLPQGITGDRSFPSGHTANAATLYVVTMFAPLTKKNWQKVLCYLLPILWIVVMAVSRVMVGAHYASDVLFGGLISIALFYISKRVVLRKWK